MVLFWSLTAPGPHSLKIVWNRAVRTHETDSHMGLEQNEGEFMMTLLHLLGKQSL